MPRPNQSKHFNSGTNEDITSIISKNPLPIHYPIQKFPPKSDQTRTLNYRRNKEHTFLASRARESGQDFNAQMASRVAGLAHSEQLSVPLASLGLVPSTETGRARTGRGGRPFCAFKDQGRGLPRDIQVRSGGWTGLLRLWNVKLNGKTLKLGLGVLLCRKPGVCWYKLQNIGFWDTTAPKHVV